MNHSQCYEAYTSLDNVKRCISEGHYVMVLMRGVAGSGKSFLAKKLLSLKGEGVILSTDDHFMVNGEYKFNQGKLDEYHKKTLQNAKTAIQGCKKLVIIDNTNIQVQHMRSYANYAATDGFEIYVVEPNNEWSRKAGQCALRNQHGVSKEQIKNCLDQLDIEQNPTLRDLVPKNYTISLMPPMDLDDEPIYTSTPLKQALSPGPPCGLPGTSTSSMFSLAHKPKPTIERVNMREMGTQSTDVIVALTSCGLADLFEEDVGEVFERERPVARGELKERPVQAPTDSKNILPEPCEDLDLLVSIYPGEDMASLQHFYEMCGLSQTIQMNLDSGIMPDYTTDVVKGAFDPDIAKALQSGSFEPEARIDNSDANTSTTDSDYHSRTLNDQIHVVDIGPNLVGQLEDIFGPIPTGSKSTTINISEQILRELYEAVIHHRTFDPTDITENDALLAQQLQEAENEAGSYQPAVLDALSQAQYLGFQQLKADFPGYNETDLKEFFKNCGYNTSMTRDFLNGHEARPMPSKTSMIAAPQTRTMFSLAPKVKGRGSGSTSPAPYNRNHVTDLGMEEAQRRAKEKIDESNEYKRKKDELMREVHMQSSNGKYYKNATADTRRAKAREYDKKEKAARADADAILREANRNSKILDLHYFTYSEALKLVKSRLQLEDRPENKRRGQSNRKLTIVTGHGQSTGGTGVVRKQIENYISSRDYKYYYENRGCIVVQCK